MTPDKTITDKLADIGGIVPAGRYAGQPVYRLEWGETATQWKRGKERIRFRDRSKPMLVREERFFVAPELYGEVADYLADRQRKRIKHFIETGILINDSLGQFLSNKSSLLYCRLADAVGTYKEITTDFRKIADTSAPVILPDWLYVSAVAEIKEQGTPLWYVTKWMKAENYTSKEAWNINRYSYDAYVPELGVKLPVVDDLGEYPQDGVYAALFEIADYELDKDGDIKSVKTAQPTYSNCIEPVLELERSREAMTKQDADPDFRMKQKEDHLEELKQQDMKRQSEYTDNLFAEALDKTREKKIQVSVL